MAAAPTLINIKIGIGENIDTYLVWQNAQIFTRDGHYYGSRSWGFPLYELFAYPLLVGLALWPKIYSLFWFILSLGFVYLLLLTEGVSKRRARWVYSRLPGCRAP